MSYAGTPDPANAGNIVTPTVQAPQAPLSQWQQMQNIMRQRAMAQALMQGNQQHAVTSLQSATNAMGMMAGAWGQHQAEDKMQRLMQNNPQLAQQAQANPGMLGGWWQRLMGGGQGGSGSSSGGGSIIPGQPRMNTPTMPMQASPQLGPQNSMGMSNIFSLLDRMPPST